MKRFSIIKAAATAGVATLMSRILGFMRDVMIAASLGAGPLADIFVVAFRLPNLFRRLFAEGAFNAAFVPVFAKRMEAEGVDAARKLSSEVLAVLLAGLIVFTLLAEWYMPYLVHALAGGFRATPEKFDLAVTYSRITFPYLVFMSLLSLYAAMLNASGRFAVAAFAPVLLNVVLIGALVLAAMTGRDSLAYLIWGVAIAGVVQFLMVWFAVKQAGLGIGLQRPRLTEDVKRVLTLGIPGVLAAGVGQINLLVGTNIASAQNGAASWLYYADRLYQLPLGVIGIALSVALLPDLSRRLKAGDETGARNSQNRTLQIAIFFSIPCAVGLYLLADPVIAVLFQRGAFSAADTTATGVALMGFAIGLPAFIGIKVLQPSFFARENTFYPFIYGALGVVANIAISLTFFPIYGHVAIAIATSIAGWLTLVTMSVHLFISGWRPDRALVFGTLAILFSAVLMAVVLYNSPFAPPEGEPNQTVSLALWLGGHILAGTVLFLFSALVTGALGRDLLGNFKSLYRASRLAKSNALRDKADENEKDD